MVSISHGKQIPPRSARTFLRKITQHRNQTRQALRLGRVFLFSAKPAKPKAMQSTYFAAALPVRSSSSGLCPSKPTRSSCSGDSTSRASFRGISRRMSLCGITPIGSLQNVWNRYTRKMITDSKIPDSHIVFLDEIFKCGDGILNLILTVLNERVYINEGQTVVRGINKRHCYRRHRRRRCDRRRFRRAC